MQCKGNNLLRDPYTDLWLRTLLIWISAYIRVFIVVVIAYCCGAPIMSGYPILVDNTMNIISTSIIVIYIKYVEGKNSDLT